MSTRNHAPHPWNDEDVESLLTDFFHHETPRDLPVPSKAVQPARYAGRRAATESTRSLGYTGLGIAACVLLLAVTALSPTGRRIFSPDSKTVIEQPVVDTVPENGAKNVVVDQHPAPIAESPLLPFLPPELQGPVSLPQVYGGPEEDYPKSEDWKDKLDIQLNGLPKKRRPRRLNGPIPESPESP